ncbi:MAG TPA: DUF4112 domain-containing protein [Caulobacteraceae bacterium]|nr:DUF4112 domain-containing protein [Caulobacteraceae bacterium]
MHVRTLVDLHNTRLSIERLRHISDRIVGLGPFGIGLDGLLGWIPGFGAIYSVGAGGLLIYHGLRVRASAGVLFQVAVLITANTFSNLIPTAGGVVDMLFTAHKWSANLLLANMDRTLYVEGNRQDAAEAPEYLALMERIRSGEERRRVVFLD